jgi:hypothetical protein
MFHILLLLPNRINKFTNKHLNLYPADNFTIATQYRNNYFCIIVIKYIMAHHREEKEMNINTLYYLVGLFSGLATGLFIDKSIVLTVVLGVVGLLFAALFLQVFVRGREQH